MDKCKLNECVCQDFINTQSVVLYFYRELRFRRRAQSADDETSTELADSLQHLTLSEFLKEYVKTASPTLKHQPHTWHDPFNKLTQMYCI